MKKNVPDDKEKLKSYELGEWKSVKDLSEQKNEYSKYARNTFLKKRRINIRISDKDLTNLKAKSLEEGIPYQSLVSSVIHKYLYKKQRTKQK